METFYNKYSKPIIPLTYENIVIHLEFYYNVLKEFLESLIFIKNELKSDFQIYSNSNKNKVYLLIDNLKNNILIILEKIQFYLIEKYNLNIKDINNKEFSIIETIRENFNSILFNLTKFFIDYNFLNNIRNKYIKINYKTKIKTTTNFDIVNEIKNDKLKTIKPYYSLLNFKNKNQLINKTNDKLINKKEINNLSLNIKNNLNKKNNLNYHNKFINKNNKIYRFNLSEIKNNKNSLNKSIQYFNEINNITINKKVNNKSKRDINKMKNQINNINFKYKELQEKIESLMNDKNLLKNQNLYLIEYKNKNIF